jgi:hypothetical protein
VTAARDPRRARLDAEQHRSLSADEAAAYLAAPVSESERAETRALVAWFRRRYPTGAARLAYVRTAYRRWRRD